MLRVFKSYKWGCFMTSNKGSGCGIWAILSTLFLVLGFASIQGGTKLNTASPTLAATVIPQQSDTAFSVKDNLITYSKRETLDLPCNYIIEGNVVDLQGKPVKDAVVNVRMVGDLAPKKPGYAFPGDGPENLGESAWMALLPNWNSNYEVWLTTSMGGETISPVVFVETKGCNNNVATLSFIQVHP